MFDDSTRRRFVAGLVSVRVAGLSGCLGGHPTTEAGSSGTGERDGTGTGTATPSAERRPVTVDADARERLDDTLVGLVEADDRSAYADREGLTYDEGRVLVVVELRGGADPPSSPPFDATARHGSLVEGRVAVEALPALATADGVASVRPPQTPVKHDPSAALGRGGT